MIYINNKKKAKRAETSNTNNKFQHFANCQFKIFLYKFGDKKTKKTKKLYKHKK